MPKKNNTESFTYISQRILKDILELKQQLVDASESKKISINAAIDIKSREYQEIRQKISPSKEPQFSLTPIFNPLTCSELLLIPEKQWLMNQVFGAGDIGMVYGAPGCGKTFIVIDMIIQMCIAGSWAGRFSVNRPLNVAYCAGEGVGGLPPRFTAALKYHKVEDLHNFTFYKSVPQFYDDGLEEPNNILQFVLEWKERQQKKEADSLDVLVIDTLHTASVSADENSAQDMGMVLKACRLANEQLGCAIILVHHTNKGGTSERGSSALRGAMDFMIKIERPEKGIGTNARMFCSKLKDGEQWRDQDFHLSIIEGCSSVHVLWNEPNEMEKSFVAGKNTDKERILNEMKKKPGFRFTALSLSEVIGQSGDYTRKLLSEMVDKKKCLNELLDKNKPSSSRNPWVYFI